MLYVAADNENSQSTDLYYEDHGSGDPIVLIHGWPLTSASWEKQVPALLDAGYRVIVYDRRGFGGSSKPATGYDYDTFAQDLDAVMSTLDLQNVSLVGFSMGAGEVARYLGKYGSDRVRKAVFISGLTPFLLKREDNPAGLDESMVREFMANIAEDRYAFTTMFLANFYNADVLGGKRVSDEAIHASWSVAAASSAIAFAECVPAWLTDFREDVASIDVPSLVIHGDADRILPIEATGIPMQAMLSNSEMVTIQDGPHGIIWTHADRVNTALLDFLQ